MKRDDLISIQTECGKLSLIFFIPQFFLTLITVYRKPFANSECPIAGVNENYV